MHRFSGDGGGFWEGDFRGGGCFLDGGRTLFIHYFFSGRFDLLRGAFFGKGRLYRISTFLLFLEERIFLSAFYFSEVLSCRRGVFCE